MVRVLWGYGEGVLGWMEGVLGWREGVLEVWGGYPRGYGEGGLGRVWGVLRVWRSVSWGVWGRCPRVEGGCPKKK